MWGNNQFFFDETALSEDGSDQGSLGRRSQPDPSYLEQFQEMKFAALRRTAQRQAVELSKSKGRCVVCTLPLPCIKHANHESWETAFAPTKLERSSIAVSEPQYESNQGIDTESEAEAPSATEDPAKKIEAKRREKIKKDLEDYHRRKEEEEQSRRNQEKEAKEKEASEQTEKEKKRAERGLKLKEDLQQMALAKEEEARKKAEDESKAAIAKKKREDSQKRYHKQQQDKLSRWHIEKEEQGQAGLAKPAPASPRGGFQSRNAAAKTAPVA